MNAEGGIEFHWSRDQRKLNQYIFGLETFLHSPSSCFTRIIDFDGKTETKTFNLIGMILIRLLIQNISSFLKINH
jgi:hypothetical protein